jgi:integrase
MLYYVHAFFSSSIDDDLLWACFVGAVMAYGLLDCRGQRKYLVESERRAFALAAVAERGPVGAFCLTLLFTGARISEVLALTPSQIDRTNRAIVFKTLKRRHEGVFRAVPVPERLIWLLDQTLSLDARDNDALLWRWGRTTAWKRVKEVMRSATISEPLCVPKALRHGFAAGAVQKAVPLNVIQRWLGHARMETTAIYVDVLGDEERALARASWMNLEKTLGYRK